MKSCVETSSRDYILKCGCRTCPNYVIYISQISMSLIKSIVICISIYISLRNLL
jgi:hypothetical protein